MQLSMTLVAEGLAFPEGPVAMSDGSVLLVEIARKTLSRVRPDGGIEVAAELGGGPNGAAIGPDGAVYVCNNGGRFSFRDQGGLTLPGHTPFGHLGGAIQRVDLGTGEAATLYDHWEGCRLMAPNDLVFDTQGGFWFTDYGTADAEGLRFGAIYYAKADGSFIRRAGRLPTPNGVGLSPDGKTVYVADTQTGRLWGCDVAAPGELGPGTPPGRPGRVVARRPGYPLVDSQAGAAAGTMRADVQPGDVLASLSGVSLTAGEPAQREQASRMLDLLMDGLRYRG